MMTDTNNCIKDCNLTSTVNEIQALAKTYKNTTHIYSEDEVSPEIEVTYYKDLETMLNNA